MATASPPEPFVFHPSAAHARGQGGDPLVNQTRREIAQIVREIATLSKQELPPDRFLSQLCDRTLRAMAAEGIVIWKRTASKSDTKPFQPICRLGKITDQTIPTESLAAHQCMLHEVCVEMTPVVVPPTPSAVLPDIPANPMEFPAAIVPVEPQIHSFAEQYLIEVFLEPVGGVATQRGYLRFVAQVADLASEFFRNDQFRSLLSSKQLSDQIEASIESFDRFDNIQQLRGYIVDTIAELFDVDRVGWCDLCQKSPLIAVSYVDQIDSTGQAAAAMLSHASIEMVPFFLSRESSELSDAEPTNPDSVDNALKVIGVVDGGYQAPDDRFVLLRSTSRNALNHPSALTENQQKEIQRFTRHATLAAERLKQRSRKSIGGTLVSPTTETGALLWKIAKSMVLATMIVLVLCIPVPNQVAGTGIAHPKSMQKLRATRDAVITMIHVAHGDSVQAGQVLLTLVDPKLEEQITSLQGRHAVLTEQQIRLTQAMVDSNSANLSHFETIRGQREITSEEIQSINTQLDLLTTIRESLVLRADRDGTVDAWQLRQKLSDKPVQRGEELIAVISRNSPWLLNTKVDQRRLGRLRNAQLEGQLTATVTLDDYPEQSFQANLLAFGPAETPQSHLGPRSPLPQSTLLVELDATANDSGIIRDAPAKIIFRCGQESLGSKLFGDLWQSIRDQVALHWGIGTNHSKQTKT